MIRRNSSIELLRIVAMFLIIDVHYFATCNAGLNTIAWSPNWIIFHCMESMGICGVNIFVLITGYFSLNQECIIIRKIINLVVDVAFWGVVGFFLCVIIGWNFYSIKDLIKAMFPILFGGRWFVKAYIVLICLIPFLNRVLKYIPESSYIKLLIITSSLFCIWPSFIPNPPLDDYGYSYVHFIYLYIIAGYIKLHLKVFPPRNMCILGYILSTGVVILCSMLGIGESWAYNFVFVVLQSVFLFMFFAQLHLNSGIINRFASCAFGVFLIHTDGFFSRIIYVELLKCNELVSGNTMLFMLSAFVSLPIFYIVGYILESLKKKIFEFSISKVLNRISVLNHVVKI